MHTLTLIELFAGVGGWSLGGKMAGGIQPIAYSEIDSKKCAHYERHHPGTPNLGDIRDIRHCPYADIFTVSFPCTDISAAGKGEGIEGPDSRLWFEAQRIIGQVRPQYVIIENSPILTHRGLRRILEALAAFGYDAEWTVIPGTAFEIQQRRERLYLVAYANKVGQQRQHPQGRVFRSLQPAKPNARLVYPGWRTRRDIPQPRTHRSTHDIPGGVHRLVCTGDAVMPLVAMYVLECVKRHHAETTTFATH